MDIESYDFVIIGSGVAGLYLGVELLKRLSKGVRIVILEKYKEIGGRAHTFHREIDGVKVQWEAGAGRISKEHTLILDLIRRYKLTWVKIGTGLQYKDTYSSPLEPNIFEEGIPAFLQPLYHLPSDILATHTIRELLTKIHGPKITEEYLIRFPYRGEVDTLRADMGLKIFHGEMGSHEGYGICAEGISAIIDGLRKEFEQRGGRILMEHELMEIKGGGERHRLVCLSGKYNEAREEVHIDAEHCVLAAPVSSVKKIKPLEGLGILKHLDARPLLRFYGVFPKDERGKYWPEEYEGRIVTSTPIRYMIPGDEKTGTVQISYTDSKDAEFWKRKLDKEGEKAVGTEIVQDLRKLLKPSIPSPTFVKAHYWDDGVTYWLPGKYSPEEDSRAAYEPMPKIHLCGESFSLRQGWMEGAAEHAKGLAAYLERIFRRFGTSLIKKPNHRKA